VNSKLRSDMAAMQQRLGGELDREYELKGGLDRSTAQLDAAKTALQAHSADLLAYSTGLSEYKEQLATWLAAAEASSVTADSAVQMVAPADVVSAQLLETVSECAAIEDAYSLLHKMLANGVITPEQFVRETRRRAVRQFELKALANKIHSLQAAAAATRSQPPPPLPSQQQYHHKQQQSAGSNASSSYSGEFVYHHGTPGMPTQRSRIDGWHGGAGMR